MQRSEQKPLDTTVGVQWAAATERVEARVDHALMVLPEGVKAPGDPASSHRLFFSGTPDRQAQMCAVVFDYAIRSGLVPMIRRILRDNPGTGDLRGAGPATHLCPTCGRET